MNRLIVVLIAAVFGIAAFPTQAEGIYAGVGVGQSKVDIDDVSLPGVGFTKDDTDTGAKIFIGVDLHKNFAIEAGYFDHGESKASISVGGNTYSARFEGTSFFVDVVGKIEAAPDLNLFGRLGMARTKLKLHESDTGILFVGSATTTENETSPHYGIGVEYMINKSVGLRGEYEVITNVGNDNTTGQSDISNIGIALIYRF